MTSFPLRLLASVLLVALPIGAVAQSASGYVPPTLVKQGKNSSPIAGPGSVEIQVFVHKDGSPTVSRILKSSNPGNDAAATEVAKTSTYRPAQRNGSPVDGFYDYVMNFGGAGALEAPATGSGVTATAYAAIRNGKYADAESQLTSYLQSHPGDVQAETLLGVANAFAGDNAAAVAAFDGVPDIPQQYRTLAIQAYSKNTNALVDQQKYKDAVSGATRLIALEPDSPEGYYLRGVANANEQQFAAAVPDLQKALSLMTGPAATPKTLANVNFMLAVAQLNSGAYQDGAMTAKEAVRLDPTQQDKLDHFALVAVSNDAIALANAGNVPDAVARFEMGAKLFPADAGNFYGQAAYLMLTQKKVDYDRMKAEADRALALDPTNGRAFFVSAFYFANKSDEKTALADMQKAKASPAYTSDANFAKQVDDNLTKLAAAQSGT